MSMLRDVRGGGEPWPQCGGNVKVNGHPQYTILSMMASFSVTFKVTYKA